MNQEHGEPVGCNAEHMQTKAAQCVSDSADQSKPGQGCRLPALWCCVCTMPYSGNAPAPG